MAPISSLTTLMNGHTLMHFLTTFCLTFRNKLQQVLVKAVIKEMSEKDRKSVLLHDGYKDDTQLINTILSEGTSLESFSPRGPIIIDPKSAKHNVFETISLDEIAIDEILAQIDMETSVDGSSMVSNIKAFEPQTMLLTTDSTDSMTPITPNMDDTICTEQFTRILHASDKVYDIPQIVRQVTNENTELSHIERLLHSTNQWSQLILRV
eukprot:435828_1